MEINTSGLYSTVYAGGGNSLTQAEPTNFHTFAPSVYCLTADIAKWREVTAAERTQIEAQDAKWEEPTPEFVAECCMAGCAFNLRTGYFELNGINDITTAQMRAIYGSSAYKRLFDYELSYAKCRTNLPLRYVPKTDWALDIEGAFMYCSAEVLNLIPANNNNIDLPVRNINYAFYQCINLTAIMGVLDCKRVPAGNHLKTAFYTCVNLEMVYIKNLKANILFSYCQRLSLESITYMVENAANTSPITITLHPDAYARVTEEIFAAAAQKNITVAST